MGLCDRCKVHKSSVYSNYWCQSPSCQVKVVESCKMSVLTSRKDLSRREMNLFSLTQNLFRTTYIFFNINEETLTTVGSPM